MATPVAVDSTTNFICHIWNNKTKERTYFRDGGVHLDEFQTYIRDFVDEYIETCTDENIHYYVSLIKNKDPELTLKLYGTEDKETRQLNAREQFESIKPYLPVPKSTSNKTIKIKKPIA